MGSSWTRAQTCVPWIVRWILNHCATREAPYLFLNDAKTLEYLTQFCYFYNKKLFIIFLFCLHFKHIFVQYRFQIWQQSFFSNLWVTFWSSSLYCLFVRTLLSDWLLFLRTGGPQHPGHRPVPICSLLGTRPQSRRWAEGSEQGKLHLPLPIARIPSWTIPAPPFPIRGNTVFHETGPWCQNVWGPLPEKLPSPTTLCCFRIFSLYFSNFTMMCLDMG